MVMNLERVQEFHLSISSPFDFALTVAKPAGWHWSTPGEIFQDGTIWAAFYLGSKPVGLKMFSTGRSVTALAYTGFELSNKQRSELIASLEHGLGKDQDLRAFYGFAQVDRILKRVVKDRYGMRLGRLDDIFGRVILAITLQMAQMTRSRQMMGDILRRYGTRLSFDGREVLLWPGPGKLSRVDEAELRAKANLGYRAKLLAAAARYLRDNPLSMLELDRMSDDEAVKAVRAIPGIGQYSAGIVLGRYAPIDAWSVIVMSELLLGRTPEKPREEIGRVAELIEKRWGKWSWWAFAYILNDLENLSRDYNLTRLT
jgi:3-methyladenine DNA glycosylase/8-oxoguanine DNA glycosylase